jgi:hypothetical protein
MKRSIFFILVPILLVEPFCLTRTHRHVSDNTFKLHVFGIGGPGRGGAAQIPISPADRDNQAISAIKAAISKPKTIGFPLIECEFPPLKELNKLGDGSLRSANEVDQANLAFCIKLVQAIAPIPFVGPQIWLLTSSAATNAFVSKVRTAAKGTVVDTLRSGIPPGLGKGDVCILIAPTGRPDYNLAQTIAEGNNAVVIVNGLAKDQESVPGRATMAYFLKPLTYNSMVSGFLIRNYPGPWTVLDAVTKKCLGTFTDQEILFKESNTPDLRASGRLVQKATDERAIAARKR